MSAPSHLSLAESLGDRPTVPGVLGWELPDPTRSLSDSGGVWSC